MFLILKEFARYQNAFSLLHIGIIKIQRWPTNKTKINWAPDLPGFLTPSLAGVRLGNANQYEMCEIKMFLLFNLDWLQGLRLLSHAGGGGSVLRSPTYLDASSAANMTHPEKEGEIGKTYLHFDFS